MDKSSEFYRTRSFYFFLASHIFLDLWPGVRYTKDMDKKDM